MNPSLFFIALVFTQCIADVAGNKCSSTFIVNGVYTIPPTLEIIEQNDFYECAMLQRVCIFSHHSPNLNPGPNPNPTPIPLRHPIQVATHADGSVLHTIEQAAFYKCPNLDQVQLPNTITSIGE